MAKTLDPKFQLLFLFELRTDTYFKPGIGFQLLILVTIIENREGGNSRKGYYSKKELRGVANKIKTVEKKGRKNTVKG